MMDLRAMIIERIRSGVAREGRLLDAYNHLILSGANSSDAIAALSAFVDEIIERKLHSDKEGHA
jgi:hypothetical protein